MSKSLQTKEEKWRTWSVPYAADGTVPWRKPSKNAESMYIEYSRGSEPVFWKPNLPFEASIKLVGLFNGAREKTHFLFENTETGAQYVMRNDDLVYCMEKSVFLYGVIVGTWRFSLNAQRCSIVPVDFIDKRGKV